MQTAQPTCEYMKMELKTLDWMHEKLAHNEMALPIDEKVKTWCWAHPKYSQILVSKAVRDLNDRWYEHPELAGLGLENCPRRVGAELDKWLFNKDTKTGATKLIEKVGDTTSTYNVSFLKTESTLDDKLSTYDVAHILRIPIRTFGRSGGVVITPEEIYNHVMALKGELGV